MADARELTSPVSVTEILSETYERRKRGLCHGFCDGAGKMYYAAACCLLHAVAMGFAVGYSAPATYHMRHSTLKPSEEQISWIGSVLALGAMVGGLIGGPLSDSVGRRAALLLNVLVLGGGWFLIVQAQVVTPVIAGRFVCGIGCGVVSVAAPAYCVEIATPQARGMLGSLFMTASATGSLICLLLGQHLGWHELGMASAAAAALALFFFAPMPESPKWWLARGDRCRAHRALRRLQGARADIDRECNRIHEELESQPRGRFRPREWLNPVVWKPAAITFGLMLFQQLSGANAVLFFSTQIFAANKDFLNPNTASAALGAVQVVATLLSNLLVERTGRRCLLLLSGGVAGASHLALAFFYWKCAQRESLAAEMPWVPLLCVGVFVVAYSLGFSPIPWLLAAEMVPLRARSRVGGLATFANGLFAFAVTKTFSLFLSVLHDYGTFLAYGIVSFASCVFVFICVPETKGKDIQEIAKFFCKDPKKRTESLRTILTGEINAIATLPTVEEDESPKIRSQSAPAATAPRGNDLTLDVSNLASQHAHCSSFSESTYL